jgi:hypothetical protein
MKTTCLNRFSRYFHDNHWKHARRHPMGTSSTTYFRSEIFAGVKNNWISFFLLISYEVVPQDFDTRVKLIYFSQFYRQYENRDIYTVCRTQWNTCLMKTNDVASVVLFVNWLECFREIWARLETKETLLLVPQDSCCKMIWDWPFTLKFFRRRIVFFRRHRNHIFLFSGEVPI